MNKKLKDLLSSGLNEYEKHKDVIKSFFEDFIKPVSFEQFNGIFSKDVDKLIIEKVEDGEKFIGGVFSYVIVDEKHFKIEYELYTQNAAKKFFKHKGDTESIELNHLVEEDRKLLISKKKIEYEIDEPSNEVVEN